VQIGAVFQELNLAGLLTALQLARDCRIRKICVSCWPEKRNEGAA
jgi:hypothetical protein